MDRSCRKLRWAAPSEVRRQCRSWCFVSVPGTWKRWIPFPSTFFGKCFFPLLSFFPFQYFTLQPKKRAQPLYRGISNRLDTVCARSRHRQTAVFFFGFFLVFPRFFHIIKKTLLAYNHWSLIVWGARCFFCLRFPRVWRCAQIGPNVRRLSQIARDWWQMERSWANRTHQGYQKPKLCHNARDWLLLWRDSRT